MILIREATRDDFTIINSLMSELNPSDIVENMKQRERVFQNIIEDPNNYIYVGTIDEVVVTRCYLNIIPNITWGAAPYALIENVVTAEPHRRTKPI